MRTFIKSFLFASFIFLFHQQTEAIRAGADYSFIVYENGVTDSVTCDFCGYDYKTYPIRLDVVAVGLIQGTIDVFFLPLDDKNINSDVKWKEIHQGAPITSELPEIEVNVWQKVRLKINQIVKLKGADLKFKLINTVGYDPRNAMKDKDNRESGH